MIRRPPRSTRTDTLFPYTTLFRSIPLPFSELCTALETKTVDGQENPFNTILSSKFYEVQKYLSVTNHVYSPWIVTASKKWWDSLSAAEKDVLMQAAAARRDYERKDTRQEADKALAALKEQDRKSTRLNSSHECAYRMPYAA